MFDETGDAAEVARLDGLLFSTPTATASATIMSSPTSRSIPTKDKRIVGRLLRHRPEPGRWVDLGLGAGLPRGVVRVDSRPNPPATALTEIYEPPAPGYSPRGMDIDSKGVVWASLASGHLASFDRRKCKGPLNGPTATGKHCPEGWTLYPMPGPAVRRCDRHRAAPRRAITPGSISTTRSG